MNQHHNTQKQTSGFTVIELMLSMTFVAVLLIAIAMTVIQIATIYNRGMTLKEVNQSARDISDDMRRTVANTEAFVVNVNGTDSADSFDIPAASGPSGALAGGRLCTGSYTYIWNIAAAVERNDANLTKKLSSGGTPGEAIRFIKVPDTGKKYCQKTSGAVVNRHIASTDVPLITELLTAGDHKLGMQRFTISTTNSAYDVATEQRIYSVNYVIGTGDTSAMNSTQTACLPPGTANSNITYCNVQSFSIVLRAGNAGN